VIDDQALFITQLLTLWAVLDPVSHLTLFMTATTGLTPAEKRRAAVFAVIFAFAILIVFGFAGQFLLHAMGISLLSFQIAGGLILLLFGLSMVLGTFHPHDDKNTTGAVEQAARQETAMSIAVYPLATPIIAGPGSILSIVLLMDNNRFSMEQQVVTIAALVTVLLVLLITFAAGQFVERVIGDAGIQLVRRVMGLLISALAVNIILSAIAIWLKLPVI